MGIPDTPGYYRIGLRARVLAELFRPVTLAPVLVVAAVYGFMGAGGWPGVGGALRILLGGLLLVIANAGSNLLNQVSDFEDVFGSKSTRPVPSGTISPSTVLSIAVLAWGASLFLSVLFLPTLFTLALILVLCFAWVYSLPPRLKAKWPLGNLSIASPRGAIGIFATWVIFGHWNAPLLWGVLFVTTPLVFFGNSSKDIDDMAADAEEGVETTATLFGETACRAFTLVGLLWPLAGVLILGLWRADPFLLLTALIAAVSVEGALHWPGKKLWLWYYVTLGLVALLFGLPTLLAL